MSRRRSGAGTNGSSSWTASSGRSRPVTWSAGSVGRRRRSSGYDMKGRRNDEFLRAAAAAASAQEAMRPVVDICQGLRQAMQPFADLQGQIARIQAQLRKSHEQNLAVIRAIQDQTRYVSAVARLQLGSLRAAAEQLTRHARRAKALLSDRPPAATLPDRGNRAGREVGQGHRRARGHGCAPGSRFRGAPWR